jgi:sialate O-acetylesterase
MALELGSPFGHHMVLQRERLHRLWGWDAPGQSVVVHVEGGGGTVTARAVASGTDGSFQVTLSPLPVGGPYRIRIEGSREIALDDVLVGDVWIASGQSNMEWPVAQAAEAAEVIRGARHPLIRWLQVARTPSPKPRRTVQATWRVVGPGNVGAMTAVCHSFARELHERLRVPIGIIDASWGGTPIEAWTSLETLRGSMPAVDAQLAALAEAERDIERVRRGHVVRVTEWEAQALPADPGNRGEALGWAGEALDATSWPTMDLPTYWQTRGMDFNGVVWFRREVDIPDAWAGRALVLELGPVDDFDRTYFGGEPVGEHPKGTPAAFQIPRRYVVPAHLVRSGRSTIAVRVFDHGGQGGFGGPAEAMSLALEDARDAEPIALAGPWRYAVEHRIERVSNDVWRTFPETPAVLSPHYAPSALFSGMIAPLVPYGLRGFIWYQGEANVELHTEYRARLVALIRDWRTRFGQGQIPFYSVQLAAFRASRAWAYLREAQTQAIASEPETGLATTIDIGDPDDIHPANKREVGRRLALLALRQSYADGSVEAYGPRLARVEIGRPGAEGRARVHYANAEGLRTVDGDERVLGFEIAGGPLVFVTAAARIEGETVVVTSPDVPQPVAVRYAFRDCPEVNLVNGAGLPAEPFRTDGA